MKLKLSLITLCLVSVGIPKLVLATPELDISNRLFKIGVLLPSDNVEGWLAEKAQQSSLQLLKQDGRFQVEDLSKLAKALGAPKAKYRAWIQDEAALKEIANTKNLNTFLRVRIDQDGSKYRVNAELLGAKDLVIMKQATEVIEDPFLVDGNQRPIEYDSKFQQFFSKFFSEGLYFGEITGRDQQQVTFSLGLGHVVKPKDTLEIATIDFVNKHPIEKTIESYRYSRAGFVRVESVDDTGGFGVVDFEESGRKIARYQKIVAHETYKDKSEKLKPGAEKPKPPEIGYVSANAFLGALTRDSSNGSTTRAGSGKLIGVKGVGELWLNPDWYLMGSLSTAMGTYKDAQSSSGKSMLAGAWNLGGGRRFFLSNDFFGTHGFVRARYHKAYYRTNLDTVSQTSNVAMSAILIGAGVDVALPLGYGVVGGLDVGLFPGGSEKANLGAPNGGNITMFNLGGYRWLHSRMKVNGGLDFSQASLDLSNSGSVSHKIVAIEGGVTFYF